MSDRSGAKNDAGASRVAWAGLIAVWVPTVWQSRFLWNGASEYRYGWIVPLLAGFMMIERWPSMRLEPGSAASKRAWWILPVAAVTYAVARLALVPFPTWTGMLWILYGAAIALSLAHLTVLGGSAVARRMAFPLGFMVTALPWPEAVRQPLVQGLAPPIARIAALIVNEFAGPAISHGTVIEVGGGTLGIEEACTGLRSMEASWMVALFLGEFFLLRRSRRVLLAGMALVVAVIANVGRTTALAWRAAMGGIGAAAGWHDPAGYVALAVTVPAIVILGAAMRRKADPPARRHASGQRWAPCRPQLALLGFICGAIMVGEVVPRLWYREDAPRRSELVVELPKARPAWSRAEFPAETRAQLNCDSIDAATWRTADGEARAEYIVRWEHGHEAAFRMALHNPAVCLPLAGAAFVSDLPVIRLRWAGHDLIFRGLRFRDNRGDLAVYSAAFDPRTGTAISPPPSDWRGWCEWRWRVICSRRRDETVTLIAIGLWNLPKPAGIEATLRDELSAG